MVVKIIRTVMLLLTMPMQLPGDVIEFAAGKYQLPGERYVTCDNITIRGAGQACLVNRANLHCAPAFWVVEFGDGHFLSWVAIGR